MKTREEKDSLGLKKIPIDAYYGVQTLRALENFPISGWSAHPSFLKATFQIKKAATQTNADLKLIPLQSAKAIVKACDELLAGDLLGNFKVDVFQAGAGTSHNMNVNEVIANRANEILGTRKGSYLPIHPNDHVNRCQSTNDVIPTAIRLAALNEIKLFVIVLKQAIQAFSKKSNAFNRVLKSGRTHLQDATPIRLGQEFGAYAQCLKNHLERIISSRKDLLKIALGGTAVGTGVNTHPQYRKKVVQYLSLNTALPLKQSPNYFTAMQSMDVFVALSAALRNLSLDLIRIANDIRLLASGPRTGFAEIRLPLVQPGSSIMPGKFNPSMAEMLNMVCFHLLGLDASIAFASQAGQLELNVMMPLIAYNLPWMLTLLRNGLNSFVELCVNDIEADELRCHYYAENSVSIATVLAPKIGYLKTAEVVKKAIEQNRGIKEVLKEEKIMTEREIQDLFDSLFLLTTPSASL